MDEPTSLLGLGLALLLTLERMWKAWCELKERKQNGGHMAPTTRMLDTALKAHLVAFKNSCDQQMKWNARQDIVDDRFRDSIEKLRDWTRLK